MKRPAPGRPVKRPSSTITRPCEIVARGRPEGVLYTMTPPLQAR